MLKKEIESPSLEEWQKKVSDKYFLGKVSLPIKWCGRPYRSKGRVQLLGSYNLKTKTISLHRLLQHPSIPKAVILFVIYHEILHHLYPPISLGKRRKIHHPLFKEKERLFEEYAQVEAWKKQFFATPLLQKRKNRRSLLLFYSILWIISCAASLLL